VGFSFVDYLTSISTKRLQEIKNSLHFNVQNAKVRNCRGRTSFYTRRSLEIAVKWLYANDTFQQHVFSPSSGVSF